MVGVAALLTSGPQMKPSSDSLMRHPSAEDLDAAHQLVSSARAGRNHGVDSRSERQDYRSDSQESTTAESSRSKMDWSQEGYSGQPRSKSDENDPGAPNQQTFLKPSSKSQTQETAFPGHSCRYASFVLYFFFFSWEFQS